MKNWMKKAHVEHVKDHNIIKWNWRSPWEVWWKKNLPWLCTWKWFETCHCLYLVWLKNKQFEVCTRMDPKPTHYIKKKNWALEGVFFYSNRLWLSYTPLATPMGSKISTASKLAFLWLSHSHFSWLSLVAQPSWCAWLLWGCFLYEASHFLGYVSRDLVSSFQKLWMEVDEGVLMETI
jgi:hypothetical protein